MGRIAPCFSVWFINSEILEPAWLETACKQLAPEKNRCGHWFCILLDFLTTLFVADLATCPYLSPPIIHTFDLKVGNGGRGVCSRKGERGIWHCQILKHGHPESHHIASMSFSLRFVLVDPARFTSNILAAAICRLWRAHSHVFGRCMWVCVGVFSHAWTMHSHEKAVKKQLNLAFASFLVLSRGACLPNHLHFQDLKRSFHIVSHRAAMGDRDHEWDEARWPMLQQSARHVRFGRRLLTLRKQWQK